MIRTEGALSVRSSHGWSADAARFDEVSCAGLGPVWSLAEQTGLAPLLARVRFQTSKVRSVAVNPVGELACVIAGMTADAGCIDELDVIRCGGMMALFDGVYAPPKRSWGSCFGSSAAGPKGLCGHGQSRNRLTNYSREPCKRSLSL